ncbi:SRPBCC family protein [Deminuibacter soli]|uniref:Polyketide cyclase n=1 Tax=Deminuibacter soli TaxID=2291815 RepID=A0A3E1NEA8_9BACT|nr:SRPBCC family protein [Deminuibacter soli]RFM26300.1 hypothetical protein DXN05_20540 [Deminuibacter soli]
MRFVKLALISLVVLFVLTTCIGLLFSSKVVVTRLITLKQPPAKVMAAAGDISQWGNWMEGVKENGLTVTKGDGKTVQSVAAIGTTTITVTAADAQQFLTTWRSARGYEQHSGFVLSPDAAGTSTTVTWFFEQDLKWYPWERFGSMMNDKILGPTMEKGLEGLKKFVSN